MALSVAEMARMSRLLDEALPLGAAGRQRWLENLAAEDASLAPALREALLQGSDETTGAGQFATLPKIGTAPEAGVNQAGDAVGPYRLIRQLGTGGMGAVWLAERSDGSFKRQVALKLPRVAWASGLAERMRRERDILAALEHSHIARLYDAGVDAQGRPYLALEYVEGEPIDVYVQRQKLPLRARLELFLQVAEAVAHAHARLVVHRDLKPSNILVNGEGQVQLLDFGIAKLLLEGNAADATQLTEMAGAALTPDYASPEQLRGETITVASDVYSLGVVLYELLTDRRPYAFQGRTAAAIAEAMKDAEVPVASRSATEKPTQKTLRGDLDTILAKALKKEPAKRYATVEAFAADIERYLCGLPVLARPDTTAYRMRKFVARHRFGVAGSLLTLIAIVGGAGVAVWQAHRAQEEAEHARAEVERANAVRDFVVGLFDLNPSDDPAKPDLRQMPIEELLQRGTRRIETGYETRPALKAELLGIAGTIYADIADPKHAGDMAHQQLAVLDAAGAKGKDRVAALQVLARAQAQENRYDLAAVTLQQAIREADPQAATEVADLHVRLARWLDWEGNRPAAEEHIVQAERLLRTELQRHSMTYANILFRRGVFILEEGKDRAAVHALFERELQLTLELTGQLSAEWITAKKWIAYTLIRFGQIDAGRAHYDELLSEIRRARGEGDLEAASLEIGEILQLKDCCRLRDSAEEGILLARLEKLSAMLDQKGPGVSALLRGEADLALGSAYWRFGEVEKAAPFILRAFPILKDRPAADERSGYATRSDSLFVYARWADDAARHEEATASWDQMSDMYRAALIGKGTTSNAIIDSEIRAIKSRIMAGDLRSASERLGRVKDQVADRRDLGDPDEYWTWIALQMEVLLNIESARYVEAKKLIGTWNEAAAQGQTKGFESIIVWPLGFRELQATIDCVTGEPRAGIAALTASLEEFEPRNSPSSPRLAFAHARLGLCALEAGQLPLARAMEASARRALVAQPAVSPFYKRPLVELERRLARAALPH